MDSQDKKDLVPKAAILSQFIDFPGTVEGTHLQDIPENALIEIQAMDIILIMAILDKDKAKVAVRGNVNWFVTPEICRLEGSTLGGAFLKMRWLGTGFNLEFHRLNEPSSSPARRITTSAVKSIIIWNDPDGALTLIKEALKKSQAETES